uniref:Monocarboxylate transporter n=1 Tax=Timema monikensis TaxID=170555 RepID=A0A7R9HSG2_9NEOP|nr:unnamed protein product [Timema monikensis]
MARPSLDEKKIELSQTSELNQSESEVPEGGWGWMVAFDLGGGTEGVTVINGVLGSSLSFTGLITNYALNTYSCRQVGLAGCLLAFVGNFLTIFANSVMYMVITFGVLQGVGFGLMITPSFAIFNAYFLRRRSYVMGLSQVLIGVGIMVYPILIESVYNEYGFRATQAIMTALTLHSLLAMLTYQPVKLHIKVKTRRSLTDSRTIHWQYSASCEQTAMLMAHAILSKIKGPIRLVYLTRLSVLTSRSTVLTDNPSLTDKISQEHDRDVSSVINMSENNEVGLVAPSSSSQQNLSKASVTSLAGSLEIQNKSPSIPPSDDVFDKGEVVVNYRVSCWGKIVNFLDLKLLLDPIYSNIAVGIAFTFTADVMFFTIHPIYLFYLGFSKTDTAVCISIGLACDLGGRLFLTVLGLFAQVKSRTLVLFGSAATVFFRTMFVMYEDYLSLIILTGVLSFFRSFLMVELPLVFAEFCSLEKFPSAYGLYLVICGIVGLFVGPVIDRMGRDPSLFKIDFSIINHSQFNGIKVSAHWFSTAWTARRERKVHLIRSIFCYQDAPTTSVPPATGTPPFRHTTESPEALSSTRRSQASICCVSKEDHFLPVDAWRGGSTCGSLFPSADYVLPYNTLPSLFGGEHEAAARTSLYGCLMLNEHWFLRHKVLSRNKQHEPRAMAVSPFTSPCLRGMCRNPGASLAGQEVRKRIDRDHSNLGFPWRQYVGPTRRVETRIGIQVIDPGNGFSLAPGWWADKTSWDS